MSDARRCAGIIAGDDAARGRRPQSAIIVAVSKHFTADSRPLLLAAATLALIVAGGALHLLGEPIAGDAVWAATVAVMLVPLTWSIARTLAAAGSASTRSRWWRWPVRWRSASTWPAP